MAIRTLLVATAGVAILACEPSDRAPTREKTPAPAAAVAPTLPASGRTISAPARAAMKDLLAGAGAGHKAWILAQPGDAEVASLAESLSGLFKEAGWEVSASTASGITLKPGVMTLAADEEFPPYVDAVVRALDGSGLDAKSASGYRGYYEAKKQENPAWPGIALRADQEFVIVIGPKPAA